MFNIYRDSGNGQFLCLKDSDTVTSQYFVEDGSGQPQSVQVLPEVLSNIVNLSIL